MIPVRSFRARKTLIGRAVRFTFRMPSSFEDIKGGIVIEENMNNIMPYVVQYETRGKVMRLACKPEEIEVL